MGSNRLRNQRGSAAVMPYSARARSGALIAAPVSWSELRDIDTGAPFEIGDATILAEQTGSRALVGWGWRTRVCPTCDGSSTRQLVRQQACHTFGNDLALRDRTN